MMEKSRVAACAVVAELLAAELGGWPTDLQPNRRLSHIGIGSLSALTIAMELETRFGGHVTPGWENIGDIINDAQRMMREMPAVRAVPRSRSAGPLASDMIQSVAGFIGKYRETGAHMQPEDIVVLETNLGTIAELARAQEAAAAWYLLECRRLQEQLLRVTQPKVVAAPAKPHVVSITLEERSCMLIVCRDGLIVGSTPFPALFAELVSGGLQRTPLDRVLDEILFVKTVALDHGFVTLQANREWIELKIADSARAHMRLTALCEFVQRGT